MKTTKVKRLYSGLASVRDYIVEECLKRKDGLIIEVDNEKMTIPFERLDRLKFQIKKTKFESKYNPGEFYELYDFKFTPDNK